MCGFEVQGPEVMLTALHDVSLISGYCHVIRRSGRQSPPSRSSAPVNQMCTKAAWSVSIRGDAQRHLSQFSHATAACVESYLQVPPSGAAAASRASSWPSRPLKAAMPAPAQEDGS